MRRAKYGFTTLSHRVNDMFGIISYTNPKRVYSVTKLSH
ncbi:hypothetical protein MNB_SV-6-869 [hydrothermal vent metagenome]|uniref:Uncharacterized protein n=1 Tax=hydrothermal vent metagenome TaxID=652676 RepID=A0A1W1BKY6_9ZZZZ